jgi:hypothetical protein
MASFPLNINVCFREMFPFHLQGTYSDTEDEGHIYLQNTTLVAVCLRDCLFLGLFLDKENGDYIFIRNFGYFCADCIASHHRR